MSKAIISFILAFAIAMPAMAAVSTGEALTGETPSGSVPDVPKVRNIRDNPGQVNAQKQLLNNELQNKRQVLTGELRDAKGEVKKSGEELQAVIKQKQDEFEKTKEAKRGEVKGKVEAAKIQLRERLEKVKDERKRTVVEKIDNQLTELNKRQTDHFSNVLGKLDKVLGRIGDRVDKAEANGRDVTAVRIAIADAVTAIAAARDAVVVQSGKTYPITVTTEDKLRADVGKARQALHTDLVKVREKVKVAREAVHKAAVTLAQIPRVDELGNLPAGGTAMPTESAVPQVNP